MTRRHDSVAWDAVVLAGGEARRMDGIDKLALEVGGRPLLDRVLQSVGAAKTRVVVGPRRRTELPVVWCREEPPGGGPAAAVATALTYLRSPIAVLLAGDQPFVDDGVVTTLLAAVEHDGAVGVDDGGEPQWLCSAWRVDALQSASLGAGESLRRALGSLRWQPVPLPAYAGLDCDTPDDLRRARRLAR